MNYVVQAAWTSPRNRLQAAMYGLGALQSRSAGLLFRNYFRCLSLCLSEKEVIHGLPNAPRTTALKLNNALSSQKKQTTVAPNSTGFAWLKDGCCFRKGFRESPLKVVLNAFDLSSLRPTATWL